MSVTCPKFFLFMTIGAFATCCGWINLIDYFDGMRNISFWIPIVSDDPLFGELLEVAVWRISSTFYMFFLPLRL